jgi:hypothetical protein
VPVTGLLPEEVRGGSSKLRGRQYDQTDFSPFSLIQIICEDQHYRYRSASSVTEDGDPCNLKITSAGSIRLGSVMLL